MWIVRPELDPGLLEHTLGAFPGAVQELVRQSRDFRDEAPYVIALGVELPSLRHRVEDTKVGGRIGAATGDPLRAGAVVREIGVDERVPELGFPMTPVQQQVLD